MDLFSEKYGIKFEKAVRCLIKDRDVRSIAVYGVCFSRIIECYMESTAKRGAVVFFDGNAITFDRMEHGVLAGLGR